MTREAEIFQGHTSATGAATHSQLKLTEKLRRRFDIWPRLAEVKTTSPSGRTLVFARCVSYYCLCVISQLGGRGGGAKECLKERFELQVVQPIILLNVHYFGPFWSTVDFDHAVPRHHFTPPALTSASGLPSPRAVCRPCRWQLHMLHKSSLAGVGFSLPPARLACKQTPCPFISRAPLILSQLCCAISRRRETGVSAALPLSFLLTQLFLEASGYF